VPHYDFEVIQGDDIIAAETSVPLDGPRAAWPKIIDLANTLNLPGCRIRVREHSGDTIILIGAAAARRFPISLFAPKGPLRPQIPPGSRGRRNASGQRLGPGAQEHSEQIARIVRIGEQVEIDVMAG
jgi:hypothetical protein